MKTKMIAVIHDGTKTRVEIIDPDEYLNDTDVWFALTPVQADTLANHLQRGVMDCVAARGS